MIKVILMMAITADGQIAKHQKHPAEWTSKADKKIFVQETKKVGVIVMGKTTYETIGKPLPGRLNIVMDLKPEESKSVPGLLEFTNQSPRAIMQDLESRGFKEMILGGGATINGLFLKENLIDEIWLTVEAKIFGDGLPLFKDVERELDLVLLKIKQLDKNVIHLRYKVKK